MLAETSMEAHRSQAVRKLKIVGGPPELHFDAVCRTACSLFHVPIALVTLIDGATVWIKARCGVEAQQVSRDVAFCHYTLQKPKGEALIFPDLLADERFATNTLVVDEPHARFYAGVPLLLQSGLHIGTLCVMDTVARPDFGPRQIRELNDLAHIVEAHLRLHEAQQRNVAESKARRYIEDAVQESERRYRLLAENTRDVIIWSTLDSTRRYVSPAAKTVFGYDAAELIGTQPLDFVHADDVEDYRQVLDHLQNCRIDHAVAQQRYRHKDGSWVWVEASFCLTHDRGGGNATGYVVSLRDITDRKKAEDALRLSEARLALALDSGSDGFWDWNIATGDIELSSQWYTMLGYAEGEFEPHIRSWHQLVHPDDRVRSENLLIEHVHGRRPKYECEYRLRTKAGDYIWTLARGKVVCRDQEGKAVRMVGTHIDITQRKQAEEQIAHMAMHDALTDLPNRSLFWDRLTQEIRSAERHGHSFAVLACDLDRFKVVNDTLGHPAGDMLLQTTAARMKREIRDGDTVARLGGDEFAVILCCLNYPDEAGDIAERLIEVVGQPIDIDGHPISIGLSIGIASRARCGADAETLFKNADTALYGAKAAGRNTHRFYDAGLDTLTATRNSLELDLREAARRGGFVLHYQPVMNLATGETSGFEALMRWQHPTRGAIPPADFISLAEETGLIVALGDWALHEACREAAKWPGKLRIAVNVSAVQFQRPGLEQSVLQALAASGIAAHRLELEITESVLLDNAEAITACLERLRALGVRIALDDFGTGYSSLSYLRRFPFDKIKIDRSFIREIDDPDTAAIVRAVVGLGARFGTAITAEGVETEDQLKRVRQEGCTEAQGFLYSKPLPRNRIRQFIASGSVRNLV